jgi:hypothetical protein
MVAEFLADLANNSKHSTISRAGQYTACEMNNEQGKKYPCFNIPW